MQAGTHIAGAVLTLAVARGFGLEVGPVEAVACFAASVLPDIDTTTSGVGRFFRPVSRFLESRFGHRTITHSLLFTFSLAALLLPVYFASPGVWFAFLYGYLSHLLLDTLNVNGVPLLWPHRLQFWFFPNRKMRVPYGSPAESTIALVMLFSGIFLWPVGSNGFDTAFRRMVATPETAVADYIDMRETNEVFAVLTGFNSETQEPMNGRYRIVEAIGRAGVIVEDQGGRAFQVSKNGQVVAYRVRAYPGAPAVVRAYRLDVGGRLLSDILAALPQAEARAVWITGNLLVAADVQPPPAAAGTFQRVRRLPGPQNVLLLHAARPVDLTAYSTAFVTSGSLVVRVEYSGNRAPDALPLSPATAGRSTVRLVELPNLPSLAGLLVEQGDTVQEGQPLARYVDEAAPAQQREDARQLREKAAQLRAEVSAERRAYQQQAGGLRAQVQAAREVAARWEKLVQVDAATRLELEAKRAEVRRLDGQLTALSVSHTSRLTRLQQQEQDARTRAAAKEKAARRSETKQLVRSPVTGKVAEIRQGTTNAKGVSVQLVLVVQEAEKLQPVPAKTTPPTEAAPPVSSP